MKPEERELVRCRLERVEKPIEKPGQAGFTLVEMVITIVVIGIIAGISAMLILQAMRGYSDQDVRADLTNQARLAIERMAREIREARDCTATDITTMAPGTLAFVDNTGTAITYTTSGTDLTRNGTALASSVSGLTFSYLRRGGPPDVSAGSAAQVWNVDVALTVSRSGETHIHRIRVHPRGFWARNLDGTPRCG